MKNKFYIFVRSVSAAIRWVAQLVSRSYNLLANLDYAQSHNHCNSGINISLILVPAATG